MFTDDFQWNNARVIVLLTLMSVLLAAFVAVQILLPRTATIPPRIVKQRSIIAGFWATLCIGASQYIIGKITALVIETHD